MSKLLTICNPKIAKGQKLGYWSSVLHLAPSRLSGFNTCPMATKGCAAACLNTAGRGGMFKAGETTNVIQKARIRKTLWFFNDRDSFMEQLVTDITSAIRRAEKHSLIPTFRLNGTSDIRWETIKVGKFPNIMEMFPDIQFYDYTKIFNRRNLPDNYKLTFSLAESNMENAYQALENGLNVAAVFRKQLPNTFMGVKVINGDEHDLRFLDPSPCIVGLKAKGRGKKDTSGFVQDVEIPNSLEV